MTDKGSKRRVHPATVCNTQSQCARRAVHDRWPQDLEESLAPARVQIAPGPITTDRREERGARLLASVTVGKAPPDFLVGRFLDALHEEAGGVSVLQHAAIAASVSQP
jgi:hypothetical protein